MAQKIYTAKTRIRHNGKVYESGDQIPYDKMNKKLADYHAESGHIEISESVEEEDKSKKA